MNIIIPSGNFILSGMFLCHFLYMFKAIFDVWVFAVSPVSNGV